MVRKTVNVKRRLGSRSTGGARFVTSVFNSFSSVLSNAGFLLAVAISLYLFNNTDLIVKFCKKFESNAFLKPIFDYIKGHTKQFCGFLLMSLSSFGALPNRFSFVASIVSGTIIFSTQAVEYVEYLALTVFLLMFFRVRSLKSRLVVILLGLLTIALGWWGTMIVSVTSSPSSRG